MKILDRVMIAGEVDSIEILVEQLLDFLGALEFRPRLFNVEIARESF
jgi:hypothetical protein